MSSSFLRLYVGNIPENTDRESVNNLVRKVCPVRETFLGGAGPTCLFRGFAIVVLDSND